MYHKPTEFHLHLWETDSEVFAETLAKTAVKHYQTLCEVMAPELAIGLTIQFHQALVDAYLSRQFGHNPMGTYTPPEQMG